MIKPLTDKDVRKLCYGDGADHSPKSQDSTIFPTPESPAPPLSQRSDSRQDSTKRSPALVHEELDEEMLQAISEHDEYIPLEFADPVELLLFIDDNFRSGLKKLHVWQEEELMRLSSNEYTIKEPLKYCLAAANGSGKDAFVIAIFCLWKLTSKVRSRTIVTSSSYVQLKNQTENYIKSYATRLNLKLNSLGIHPKACIIKREHIGCNITGSEIIMFVTDDPGRAEGFHPFPDYGHNIDLKEKVIRDGKVVYPGGDLTIIQNEAKTIPDDIDEALGRCTYNRLLKISSPGHTSGHFYNDYRRSVCYPAAYDRTKIYSRRVTSYDCAHISRVKIDQDREYYGENSPIFRSKHLALFTSVGEQVVIVREALTSCLEFNPARIDIGLGRRAGLDLAQGGDENCLYIFEENMLIGWESFTMIDTHMASKIIVDFFNKWQLKEGNIYGDDGVAGHGHIDNLQAAGWNINRVRNQSPALIKQHYGNRGAELWFNFARLIQERFINLSNEKCKLSQKAIDQLSSRYYKQQETLGKLILESKKEARANGHSSPDHADAIVLAMCGVTVENFRGKSAISDGGSHTKKSIINPVDHVMQERDKHFDEIMKRRNKGFGNRNGRTNTIQGLMQNLYGK